MTIKTPTTNVDKLIDFKSGINSNLSTIDNKLSLLINKTIENKNLYAEQGFIEFKNIDLEQFFLNILKLNISSVVLEGNICKIYTSTSKDRYEYEEYKEINQDGTINSTQNRFLNIKIEFVGKKDNVSLTKNDFKSEEKIYFENNEYVTFNDSLQLKTQYDSTVDKISTTSNGTITKLSINKNKLKKIDSLRKYLSSL